ncbi:MAG: DUF6036 family nucleotidyltransferase [Pseudomonadota bacterium]
MQRFTPREIERFLKAVDRSLARRFDLVVIGGAAVALAYHATNRTVDIDTVGRIDQIASAFKTATKDTGLNIPVGPAKVFDGPYHYRIGGHHTHSLSRHGRWSDSVA